MAEAGSKPGRQRLDVALVERGLAETRARAQALIMGGAVRVQGKVETKPALSVAGDAEIELVAAPQPYASRGGLKLAHALDRFGVDPGGKVAIDVGASTGGFTDVLLQAGARRVYAIDVGYGQLAWSLRNDPRVVVMERTNIRHVESLPDEAELAMADVSFISLRMVLPAMKRLVTPSAQAVVLIKPQFEAGRGQVGKKGVVRDPATWRSVLVDILTFAEGEGWSVVGLERSPIQGPAGNVEFLAHLSLAPAPGRFDLTAAIGRVVAEPTADG